MAHRRKILISAAALALCGCSPGAADVPPPVLPVQSGWSHSPQPVLEAGALLDKAMWNDPSVIRTGDGYVMYATTSIAEPWKPPVLPFRLVSADGSHWQLSPAAPLLQPVAPFSSIETPSVVQFGGRWHMFFTGVHSDPDPSPMSIGHAVSTDGISWTIDKPLLLQATGKTGDWRSYLVAEPGAVVVGNRLIVYFSAVGARSGEGPPQDQSIGAIVSTDGINFSPPSRVLTQGAMYPPAEGFVGYSSPAAVVEGSRIHLFYSVAQYRKGANPEWRQVAIHHASSADGLSAFVEDEKPVLSASSVGWASGEVLAPSPVIEDGKLKLWFSGHVPNSQLAPLIQRGFKGPEFGIGIATIGLDIFRGDGAAKEQSGGSS